MFIMSALVIVSEPLRRAALCRVVIALRMSPSDVASSDWMAFNQVNNNRDVPLNIQLIFGQIVHNLELF